MTEQGRGAREKVYEYFNRNNFLDAMNWTPDHFLMWLAAEGYMVVPMETAQGDQVAPR